MRDSMQKVWSAGRLGKTALGGPAVVFGQVREDPSAELLALRRMPRPAHLFTIASGGCTTFALLSAGPESLTACDINPAQCALLESKKALLERLDVPSIHRAFLALLNRRSGKWLTCCLLLCSSSGLATLTCFHAA